MSNRTIDRLREIYIERNGGFKDFGWKDDPDVDRTGEETLFTRNADGSITEEHYCRAKRYPDKTYPNEEAVVDDYAITWGSQRGGFQMSNRTIDRLREIYEQTSGGFKDFGWKDDPTVQRTGEETLFTRNPDGTITEEHHERGNCDPDKIYANEDAVVDYYMRVFRVTEEAFK